MSQPILTNIDLQKICAIKELAGEELSAPCTLDATWPAVQGEAGLAPALERMCQAAAEAVRGEYNILALSGTATYRRSGSRSRALLATASVHHHLIREGLRTSTGLVVETGEAREVHHFCVLAGYGAEAVNPYLALREPRRARADLGTKSAAAQIRADSEELHQGGSQARAC